MSAMRYAQMVAAMSSRGTQRERAVKEWLMDRDWWVARAAGSLGDADLVALRPGARWLIEVKSTAQGPYERFGPKDRARLRFAAQLADASPVLAWWPPRGKLVFLHAHEWPPDRTPFPSPLPGAEENP